MSKKSATVKGTAVAPIAQTATNVVDIPIALIVADEGFNARKSYDPQEIKDLAASIKRNGQQSPVLVTPRADGRYDLIFGFQRFKAISEILEAKVIRATVKMDAMSGVQRKIANLVENVQRSNLSSFDLAVAVKEISESEGLKGGQIGSLLSKSEGYVNNLLRVLDKASPTVLDRWKMENAAGSDLRKVLTTDALNRIIRHDEATQDLMLRKELGEEVTEEETAAVEASGAATAAPELAPIAGRKMLESALHAIVEARKEAKNVQTANMLDATENALKFALGHVKRIPGVYDYDKEVAAKEAAKAAKEKEKLAKAAELLAKAAEKDKAEGKRAH